MVYRICLSVITGSTVYSLLNKVCNSIYVKKKKLEMRLAREESSREFLWKETDREKMLVEEEEKKLLATSSKKIDEAKKTKAQLEWARLESKEGPGECQP
jgi:hypothetical protein